jgi:hypothetical protein
MRRTGAARAVKFAIVPQPVVQPIPVENCEELVHVTATANTAHTCGNVVAHVQVRPQGVVSSRCRRSWPEPDQNKFGTAMLATKVREAIDSTAEDLDTHPA